MPEKKLDSKSFNENIELVKIFQCSKCGLVPLHPVSCFVSQKVYCRDCVGWGHSENLFLICALNKLKVTCPKEFCSWKGILSEYLNHELHCKTTEVIITCPIENCNVKLNARYMKHHLNAKTKVHSQYFKQIVINEIEKMVNSEDGFLCWKNIEEKPTVNFSSSNTKFEEVLNPSNICTKLDYEQWISFSFTEAVFADILILSPMKELAELIVYTGCLFQYYDHGISDWRTICEVPANGNSTHYITFDAKISHFWRLWRKSYGVVGISNFFLGKKN